MANLNINKVFIGGRLASEPDQRATQTGIPVTTFKVAVNRRKTSNNNSEPAADFFTVVAWRALAEFVAKYFHKGSSILVEGSLQERQWTDQQGQKRYSTEIIADQVYFVDSKNEAPQVAPVQQPVSSSPSAQSPEAPQHTVACNSQNDDMHFEDISALDDLPF
jgi:single-strand DNA-binding protein